MSNLDIAVSLVPRGKTIADGALFIYQLSEPGTQPDARLDDAGGNITLRGGNAMENEKPIQIIFHLSPQRLTIGDETYDLSFPATKAIRIKPGNTGTKPVFEAPLLSDAGRTLKLVSRRRDEVTYKYALNVIARSSKGAERELVDDPKIKNGGVAIKTASDIWTGLIPLGLALLGIGVLVGLAAPAAGSRRRCG